MSRMVFAVIAVLIVASMVITSCASPIATPAPSATPVVVTREVQATVVVTPTPAPTQPPAPAKKVLRYTAGFVAGDVPTLDPSLAQDATAIQVIQETTIGLTRANEVTNVPEPGMATGWDISADGTVYTFTLRSDVPWVKWDNARQQVVKVQTCPDANGKTTDRMVTAKDIQYGFLRTLDPKTASPYAYVLNFVVDGAEAYNTGTIADASKVGINVADDHTLVLKFKQPAAFNTNIAGMWMGRAEPGWLIDGDECTQAKGDRWTETGAYQGYGPYTLKEWVHDSTLTIVKNPFWPGSDNIPQAKIEEVVFSMLDPEPGFVDYEAGIQDVASVPLSDIDRVKADPTLSKELKISRDMCTYLYEFNTKAPLVNDPRVRLALSEAIDRQSLIDSVTKGGQEPAQWLARPGLAAAPTTQDHPDLGVKFNPDDARRQLQSYLNEKKLTADKLDLTLMFNTNTGQQKIAEATQQMWKENLSLDVKLASQEWKVFLDTIKDPKNTPQIFWIGWCMDYPDANNFDKDFIGFGGWGNPAAGGGVNWKNDPYESLIAQAAKELDNAKRTDLYARAEEILVKAEAAIAPVYWNTIVAVTKPYITRTFASSTAQERFEKWDIDMSAKGQ